MFTYFIISVISLTVGYFIGVGATMYVIQKHSDKWALREGNRWSEAYLKYRTQILELECLDA